MAQIGEVGGEPLILGYDFLEINDWMLLTLVTADLLGESTTPYLIRYVAIIAFLLLVMVAIALSVIWYYRRILEHIQGYCADRSPDRRYEQSGFSDEVRRTASGASGENLCYSLFEYPEFQMV